MQRCPHQLADLTITCCNNPDILKMETVVTYTNVYVWDMDETLILLKSLLDGTFAEGFHGSKNVKNGIEIGKHWENYILRVCDDLFFYEQIENYNEPFLDSLSHYDDGKDLSNYDFLKDNLEFPCDDSNKRKLAYRHRLVAEKYTQGLYNVLDEDKIKLWDDLYGLTDSFTDGWLSSARALLGQTQCQNHGRDLHLASFDGETNSGGSRLKNVNVLVTNGSLIPSLVKCLLFRLNDSISHGNVYSSWEVGKYQCFQWIKERFGDPTVRFCVIGDGSEECSAAGRMGWPFIKIDTQPNGIYRFPGLTIDTLHIHLEGRQ